MPFRPQDSELDLDRRRCSFSQDGSHLQDHCFELRFGCMSDRLPCISNERVAAHVCVLPQEQEPGHQPAGNMLGTPPPYTETGGTYPPRAVDRRHVDRQTKGKEGVGLHGLARKNSSCDGIITGSMWLRDTDTYHVALTMNF